MKSTPKVPPPDPNVLLEQRFSYRIQEYVATKRKFDAEFSLAGVRGWMLSQRWPEVAPTAKLECLAVLSWAAICQVEAQPEHEEEVRRELGRQLDFLTGNSTRRPASLNALLSSEGRCRLYASLRSAAEPGPGRSMAPSTYGFVKPTGDADAPPSTN